MTDRKGVVSLVACALALTACPSNSAKVTVQFSPKGPAAAAALGHARAAGAGTQETPTSFGLKLVAATVSVGYGIQDGTALVYLNPQCGEDYTHCSVTTNPTPPTDDGKPVTHLVTDYFELVDPAAANAALNGQAREIDAKTYHDVTVDFCHGQDFTVSTVQWTSPSNPSTRQVNAGCAHAQLALVPPLEVAAGDEVTIHLEYDLTNAITIGTDSPTSSGCVGTGPYDCVTFPAFTVSATKK